MDMSTIANFLLFLGAFATSFVTTEDTTTTADETDSLYDSTQYSREVLGSDEADDMQADGDNLAWFMEGGDDTLSGSSGKDYADLGTGDDAADMGAGNDIVEAKDGDDSVSGGTGDDIALGGLGHDSIYGQTGNDSLAGEEGDDSLIGGSGIDILSGGAGNDMLSGFSPDAGATGSMTTADGIDQLFGGAGDDHILLGRGDLATGGAGQDSFTMDGRWRDGSGLFTINDYNAEDDQLTLLYAPSIDPNTSHPTVPTVTVHLSADGESSVILLNGIAVAEVMGVTTLTAADVQLEADTETDTGYRPEAFDSELDGSDTDDDLTGSEGEDYGRLGDGDDSADLGEGHDSVHGDAGDDSLHGEAGNDTLYGDDGQDQIDGGADNDILNGGTGNDALGGGAGNDVVQGGAGNDTVSGFDATGAGGTASAADGMDTLSGGDGEDHLIIGRGDSATGGTGADTFELDATLNDTTAFATINDFTRGTDHIELAYKPVFNAQGVEIPPVVRVLSGPNGSYSIITLNGDPLAHVMGVSNLTLAEITLVREA